MSERVTPVRITVDAKSQSLNVRWADGHESAYPFDGLRRACPCAECRGGHENMGEPVDPIVFLLPALQVREIKRIEPVGSYGMRIYWEDGHHHGIFRWDALRDYCPCDACRGVRGEA